MDAKPVKIKIRKLPVKLFNSRFNVFILIMKNHRNDVKRRMVIMFTEITGFIYKNAELPQLLSLLLYFE